MEIQLPEALLKGLGSVQVQCLNMKVRRTIIILTILLYASVVPHPGNAEESAKAPASTAAAPESSSPKTNGKSADPPSPTTAPSASASNSTTIAKPSNTTVTVPESDPGTEAVNAVVNMLRKYMERISEAIQTNLPGAMNNSRAMPKYVKATADSPWDFLRGLKAFQGALNRLGITPPDNKTTVGGKKRN
ncbi:unnamed protein product [Allacma fusca]|uniref:Uncharacterized protein n=1 Tax=Allacma fusca TaxID=39272 RepID=A0A8J2LSX5_9HEXA|nr:unnamed protein product [Allacma fusca]